MPRKCNLEAQAKYYAGPAGPLLLAKAKDRYKKDPKKARNWTLQRKFGISLVQYEEILASQNYTCAICHKPESVKRKGIVKDLAVDHNHITKKIRGLLCQACNIGIGQLKLDDTDAILVSSLKYREKHDNS